MNPDRNERGSEEFAPGIVPNAKIGYHKMNPSNNDIPHFVQDIIDGLGIEGKVDPEGFVHDPSCDGFCDIEDDLRVASISQGIEVYTLTRFAEDESYEIFLTHPAIGKITVHPNVPGHIKMMAIAVLEVNQRTHELYDEAAEAIEGYKTALRESMGRTAIKLLQGQDPYIVPDTYSESIARAEYGFEIGTTLFGVFSRYIHGTCTDDGWEFDHWVRELEVEKRIGVTIDPVASPADSSEENFVRGEGIVEDSDLGAHETIVNPESVS